MREWYLALAPVAAIIYFIFFPDQFNMLIGYAERLLP